MKSKSKSKFEENEFYLPTSRSSITSSSIPPPTPPIFYTQEIEIEKVELHSKRNHNSSSTNTIKNTEWKPFELPVIRRRFSENNSSTYTASMMVCTDPNCTTCSPELHSNIRSYRTNVSKPTDPNRPIKTLKEELDGIGSSDDDDNNSVNNKDNKDNNDNNRINKRNRIKFCGFGFCLYISEIYRMIIELSSVVISPHSTFILNWNKFFVCICLLSFFIDPLFFFSLYFNHSKGCIDLYWKTVIVLTVIRTITDLVYIIHIILQFRIAYVAKPRHRVWWGGFRQDPVPPGEPVTSIKFISKNYIKGQFFFDFFAALPLPQIIFLVIVPSVGNSAVKDLLRIVIFLQTIPRVMRFYPLISGSNQSRGFVFESASSNFILNLVLFIIISHFVGSTWYLLSIQRLRECLARVCSKSEFQPCKSSYLDCRLSEDFTTSYDWFTRNDVDNKCFPDDDSGKTSFINFGIYQLSIPYLKEEFVVSKYIYSLYWGFQQISTLAGNQQPSPNAWEALFLFCITALGLLLFALLIGNIQSFLQSLSRRAFDYQIRRMDMEEWINRRNLPLTLKKRIKDLEKLQWSLNRGVDETELISSLTEDLQRDVRKCLCMDLLTKSELFSAMDEQVQDAIFERLQSRGYVKGTVIIKEDSPVKRMFFVLKGELESIATNRGRTGIYSVSRLKKGDFFGEELFIAFVENEQNLKVKRRKRLESFSSMDRKALEEFEREREKEKKKRGGRSLLDILPRSERTVVCSRAVEGFSLDAHDLEYVCMQFRNHMLSKKVQNALNKCSHNRREKAAMTIQLAWRTYLRKKLGLSIKEMEASTRQRRLASIFQAATKLKI